MDISQVDLKDNQQLDTLRLETLHADRETLIEALKVELATPLPDNLEKKAEAVLGRDKAFQQIREINDKLAIPSIEAVSLKDVLLVNRSWMLYPLLPDAEVTLCTDKGE